MTAVRIALDLGTNCGWALEQAGVVTSGVQSFKPGRYDGGGMRYLRFRRWLDELRGGAIVERIAFEEVRRHVDDNEADALALLRYVMSTDKAAA